MCVCVCVCVCACVCVCVCVSVCRLLFARDDALKRVGPDGPSYGVAQIQDKYSTHIFRQVISRIHGTFSKVYIIVTGYLHHVQ